MPLSHSINDDELASQISAIEGWAQYQVDEHVEQLNAIIKSKSWNNADSKNLLDAFGLKQLKMLSKKWDSAKIEAHIRQKVGNVVKVLQNRKEKEAIAEYRAGQRAKQLSRERNIQQIKDLLTLLERKDFLVTSNNALHWSDSDTSLEIEDPAINNTSATVSNPLLSPYFPSASLITKTYSTAHVDRNGDSERLRPPFESMDDILVNYWGDEFSALRYFRTRSEKLVSAPIYFDTLQRFRFDNWTPCTYAHTRTREPSSTFDALIDATENLRPPILSFQRWEELEDPKYARYRECEGDIARYRKHVASDEFVFGRTNYYDKYPLVKDDPILFTRNHKPRSPQSEVLFDTILPAISRRSSH
jgi:hypothetical protein